ncbi:MAG: ABC transporter substrate-binding protein [Variibacter sp.]
MTITLQETFRALFYAPFYAALSLDAFADEDVSVEFRAGQIPGGAHVSLLQGSVDAIWGGPMRVMSAHDSIPNCDLVCFCEVVARDPFSLLGRKAKPDFQLTDLAAMTLATVSEVPTPWMCLQEDLRRVGVDPAQVRRKPDQSMRDNRLALIEGAIDVAQLFQPDVYELVARGDASVWYAAASRGACSYTTLYTRRPVLEDRSAEFEKITRAVYRTQKWVKAASPAAIARAIRSYFPDLPETTLAACCAWYRDMGVWGDDPILPEDGYNRQRAGLLSGGLIKRAIPFEEAVDNQIAQRVVQQDPPMLDRSLTAS